MSTVGVYGMLILSHSFLRSLSISCFEKEIADNNSVFNFPFPLGGQFTYRKK